MNSGIHHDDQTRYGNLKGYYCHFLQFSWKKYGVDGTLPWDGMAAATSPTLDLGTLVLDMYDPKTKRLVWTETATKALESGSNQEEDMKNLDQTVGKLFKNYPPR